MSGRCILSRADEKFERYYKVKRSGYDLDKAALRAASLCAVEVDDIFSRNRQKSKVKARSLFCYWVSRELGVSHTELARQLGISVPAVSYSVERGEMVARENNYLLIEQ